tara:strand:- start:653 stop:1537 length:885 start_codon:yes stop_codon:yes gene_type:complete
MDIEISRLNVHELKERLRERRLSPTGNKADLIQRLKEDINPLLKEKRIEEEQIKMEQSLEEERLRLEEERLRMKEHIASYSHYRGENQDYTLRRGKLSRPMFFGILFAIMSVFFYINNPGETGKWYPWYWAFILVTTYASSFGTATTTHQFANSTVEFDPFKLSAYQALIIRMNQIVILFSLIYAIDNKTSWIDNLGVDPLNQFVDTFREFLILGLITEIIIDFTAVVYVSKRSSSYDSFSILVFFITECILIVLSGFEIVSEWILVIVAFMFAIAHLRAGNFLERIKDSDSDV